MPIINPPADLDFPGSTLILTEQMIFPDNPRNGNFAFVDGALHIYGSAENVTTWYPLTNRNQYYIHIQEAASTEWAIVHNLNTINIIHMSYDTDGLTLDSTPSMISDNEMRLTFTEPKSGTVIFFVTSEAQLYALEQIVTTKANSVDVYTKAEISTIITEQLDLSALVNVDAVSLSGHAATYFAIAADTYNKTEVAALVAGTSDIQIDASTLESFGAADFARYSATGTVSNSLADSAWITRAGDHIWHDDVSNTWNLCSDTTFKAVGNAAVRAGSYTGAGTGLTGTASALSIGGTAARATALVTARTIDITGDIVANAVPFDGTANIAIVASVVNDSHTHDTRYYTETEATARFLPIGAKAADANLLDGISGERYLRSDAADIKTAGSTTYNDNIELFFGTNNDCNVFCSGDHMYMDLNSGIGNFYIRDGTTTRFTFDDAGSFTAIGNVTAYSDERVKTNFEVIPDALAKVQQISGYTFDRTDINTPRQTGVLAQELIEVLPEAVLLGETSEDMMSVAYGNIVGLLIEAIKELSDEVADLREQVLPSVR